MTSFLVTLVAIDIMVTMATASWLWQRIEGELHRRTLFLNHRMTELLGEDSPE